jgi:hypothetical protein
MAIVSLNNTGVTVDTSKDSIIIVENFESIRGGRSLNTTGYPKEVINAGHVIIRSTANGDYKPMPLNTGGTAYETLPANHTYAGILSASILTKRPLASIMIRGTVNTLAAYFSVTSIQTALTAALPGVFFRAD